MLYAFILILMVFVIGLLMIGLSGRKRYEVFDNPNYKLFFILGVIFLVAGLVMVFVGRHPYFLILAGFGFIFMVIGLWNRSKWSNK